MLRALAQMFLAAESKMALLFGGEEMDPTTRKQVAKNTIPKRTPRQRASEKGTLQEHLVSTDAFRNHHNILDMEFVTTHEAWVSGPYEVHPSRLPRFNNLELSLLVVDRCQGCYNGSLLSSLMSHSVLGSGHLREEAAI